MGKENKHPAGLYFLFFTEMWERFGFYLMVGIFFLYMTDKETGGLGLTRRRRPTSSAATWPSST